MKFKKIILKYRYMVVGLALLVFLLMPSRGFDSKAWIERAGEDGKQDSSVRYSMLKDLMNNHLKLGQDKAEIMQLVGEPNSIDYSRNALYYLVKIVSTISSIHRRKYLVLDFDENNKLVSMEVKYQ